MKERLEKYIAKSSEIRISTEVDDEKNAYFGIPVRISRSLLAFHQIDDFHFNGFRIVRLKDIVKIRRSRYETVFQRIMRSTGELESHANPTWLRIGSWKSLLASLKKKGLCAGVESALKNVDIFWLGEVHALKNSAVVLKSFDAYGKWHKPKHSIEYRHITEVFFGDEYSVTFHEFMKNR